jgi:predicted NBD/HSP70 family sugar kinase
MRATLVSSNGTIVRRPHVPPQRDDDLDSPAASGRCGHRRRLKRGRRVPGRGDYRLGRLGNAPNLPQRWMGMLREDHLSEGLGLEVALANDADAAAVGEAYFGEVGMMRTWARGRFRLEGTRNPTNPTRAKSNSNTSSRRLARAQV